mgnify:CR=1 FL=1
MSLAGNVVKVCILPGILEFRLADWVATAVCETSLVPFTTASLGARSPGSSVVLLRHLIFPHLQHTETTCATLSKSIIA